MVAAALPGQDQAVTVLVVDRSAPVRRRLVARLREADHEVVEAASLAEAFAAIATSTPDAIVADAQLPDGRGASIAGALRARAPRAVLVILTNATHYRDVCLGRGADHFLDKSAEFDVVAERLTIRQS